MGGRDVCGQGVLGVGFVVLVGWGVEGFLVEGEGQKGVVWSGGRRLVVEKGRGVRKVQSG